MSMNVSMSLTANLKESKSVNMIVKCEYNCKWEYEFVYNFDFQKLINLENLLSNGALLR